MNSSCFFLSPGKNSIPLHIPLHKEPKAPGIYLFPKERLVLCATDPSSLRLGYGPRHCFCRCLYGTILFTPSVRFRLFTVSSLFLATILWADGNRWSSLVKRSTIPANWTTLIGPLSLADKCGALCNHSVLGWLGMMSRCKYKSSSRLFRTNFFVADHGENNLQISSPKLLLLLV